MKSILHLSFLLFFTCSFFSANAKSTNDSTTIILVRDAEQESNGLNPGLSAFGNIRAQDLPKFFKNLSLDELYSANFFTTLQTLAPWSKFSGIKIKPYDANFIAEFAYQLLKSQLGKSVVVAGPDDTIPVLANMLTGSTKYSELDEEDKSNVLVITIINGKMSEKIVKY